MKKWILSFVILTCLLSGRLSAQVFFTDDFSDSTLTGWTVVNENAGTGSLVVWAWSNDPNSHGGYASTFNAAGASNGHIRVDSDNSGATGTSEYTTITSKAINCTGKSTILLGFTEYYRKYQLDSGVVYVSSDSVNWTPVYRPFVGLATNQGTANPDVVEVNISAVAANQATVYIRFSWWGEWDYYWFVDDVKLRVPDPEDVIATGVFNAVSNGCNLSNAEPISIRFKNGGLSAIDSLDAVYSINNGAPVTEHVHISGGSLAYDSSYTYTFTTTADFSAANVYNISAWLQFAGDTVHANDTAFSFAVSASPINLSTPYTMGFEVPNIGTEIGGYTWTTEDANQDAVTWQLATVNPHLGSVHFQYLYNFDGVTAADDWLFSPCLTMDATKAYRIDFFDETGVDQNGAYPESLELKAGTTKSAVGMTSNITDFGAFTDTSSYNERKAAFKPSANGVYYVGFHCYSSANEYFLDVDDVTIDILPPPNAQFAPNVTGNSVTVTDGSDDLITNWAWNWGDGNTSTGQVPGPHTYAASGTYNVCLVVTNLAGSDSICHSVTIVGSGIKDLDVSNQISVFPNPTNKILNVVMNDAVKNNSKIEIVDMLGETVISTPSRGNTIEKFDMSNMAQGVYFVRITNDGMKAVKKFIYAK